MDDDVGEYLSLVAMAEGNLPRRLLRDMLTEASVVQRVHDACGLDITLLASFYCAIRVVNGWKGRKVSLRFSKERLMAILDACAAHDDDAVPIALARLEVGCVCVEFGVASWTAGALSDFLLSYNRLAITLLWVSLHASLGTPEYRMQISDSGSSVVAALNEYSSFYLLEQAEAVELLFSSEFPHTLYASDFNVLLDVLRRERRNQLDPSIRKGLTQFLYLLKPSLRVPPTTASCADVALWMSGLELSEDYGAMITQQGIDGDVLGEALTEEDWQEIGVRNPHDRRKILENMADS